MSKGFDCTANVTPHVSAIKAAGYAFVARYTSHSAWKNLTLPEVHAISKAGLKVVNVWETNSDHLSYFNFSQGIADGVNAHNMAKSLHQPIKTPIYFAVDCDIPGSTPDLIRYFEGLRQSLQSFGHIGSTTYAVGVYGSGDVCKHIKSRGYGSYTWLAQSMGWTGSRTYADWNIKQGPSTTLFGMDVDTDISNGNAGAWSI